MEDVTAVIVARNAAETIERALRSVESQVASILVVDDFSTDNTAILAEGVAPERTTVVKPPTHRGIGLARQTALENCSTPFVLWLDADDEVLPGRATALRDLLVRGADYAFDRCELWDQEQDKQFGLVAQAPHLTQPGGLFYLFQRNDIPAPGVPMARLESQREIGYDPSLSQAEDYDHLLRAVVEGKRISLSDSLGYRQYHSRQSTSRRLDQQNEAVKRALQKHAWEQLEPRMLKAGLPLSEARWIGVWMAMRLGLWALVLERLGRLPERNERPSWHRAFFQSVALIELNQCFEAKGLLEKALSEGTRPDLWNNLGVAQARLGEDAVKSFRRALSLYEHYFDAGENLVGKTPLRVTRFPLRLTEVRDLY